MTLKLGTKNLHYEILFHFEVLQPISKENTFEIDLVMCQSDLKPVSYKSKSSGKAIKLKKVSQIQPKIMYIQAILLGIILNQISATKFYDLTAKDIYGLDVDFHKFEGKVLLLVNVASKCGFTDSHYRDLQRLQVSNAAYWKKNIQLFSTK